MGETGDSEFEEDSNSDEVMMCFMSIEQTSDEAEEPFL